MKHLAILTCLLVLVLGGSAGGQTPQIDSLRRVIETTKVDTVRGRTLCRLCGRFQEVGKSDEAFKVGQQGLELCGKADDRMGTGICFNNMGLLYQSRGNHVQALDYYEQSIKIFSSLDNQEYLASALGNMGNFLQKQGKYEEAIKFIQKTLEYYHRKGDVLKTASSYINLGNIYSNKGDHVFALDYYQRGFNKFEENKNKKGMAIALASVAGVYRNKGIYTKALDYYIRARQLFEELDDSAGLISIFNNMSVVYHDLGDSLLEIDCLLKSLKLIQYFGSKESLSVILNNIGKIYGDRGDYRQALYYFKNCLKIRQELNFRAGIAQSHSNIAEAYLLMGQPRAARIHAQASIKIAREVGHTQFINFAALALYRADSALGNWKSALDHYKLYRQYDDSLRSQEKAREFGRLEAQWQADQQRKLREAQIAAERAEELAQTRGLLGSAGAVLLLLAFFTFNQLRHRRRQRNAYTHLQSLYEQISEQNSIIERQHEDLCRQRDLLVEQHLHLQLAYEDFKLEQEARMQTQRLAGIGEISSIVAHEINTPLSVILGGSEALMQRIFDHAAELEGIDPDRKAELQRNLSLAATAAPLSAREERAACRQFEKRCAEAGFSDPETAARLIVQSGLREVATERTLRWAAERPVVFHHLINFSQQLSQLTAIRQAAQRAAGIITILRAYTQQGATCVSEGCPRETLELVLKLYDYHLNQGIQLEVDIPDRLPRVALSSSNLMQIWTKLLLFSMYGMRKHGLLRIRFEVGAGSLQVFWSDNGPIPGTELLDQAFEPGINLRQTDPPVGLWLCRSLLESNGGSIRIGLNEALELSVSCWMPLSRCLEGEGLYAERLESMP